TAVALEASEQQMNLAVRAARLSMWIWDTKRKRLVESKRRRDRRKPDGAIPFAEVLDAAHPADRDQLERAVDTALATGRGLEVEDRTSSGAGKVSWVAARGRTVTGRTNRVLGIALDITERKAAELRAAQDRTALRHMTRVSAMGQLSAAIAHQLNQPLAAILGNAEAARKMLGHANLELDELKEICDDIISEDRRAADVIRRLSDLYKRVDTTSA